MAAFRDETLRRAWGSLVTSATAVIAAAAAAAVLFESRLAAWALVGAAVLLFLSRFTIGVVSYRRVMSRPWPRVAPLPDDDDW